MLTRARTLIIRADASSAIGLGHVMRCLALAQAWRDVGGTAVFAMRRGSATMIERLAVEQMEVTPISADAGTMDDALETAEEAARISASWIVVDGYLFGAEYQERLKESGARLCCIDDLGGHDHYWADVVLNQNLHATEALYQNREPYTRLLLGSRYALLRREFVEWRVWDREIPPIARRLLVTLGGGDLENVTLKALEALDLLGLCNLETMVVVGNANPHSPALAVAASKCRHPITMHSDVTNMAEAMAWADLALSGAGSTCWELAFMGLPSVMIPVAANQVPVSEGLEREGIGVNLGWHSGVSPERIAAAIQSLASSAELRSAMAKCARDAVDGRGAERLVRLLLAVPVVLRRASIEDCELLWNWRNDPLVRSLSFSSDLIPWEVHLHWLKNKLKDPQCWIFVGLGDGNKPVGQIRVELGAAREAEVHISIDTSMRGRGHGSAMLLAIQEELFRLDLADTIHAFIKSTNRGSIYAFQKAGFVDNGHGEIGGQAVRHYVCAVRGALS
jgi:UDP-2,4-diacetamido-2,4,6-trideoxy-beta-L-altropyranose hydrolase